MFGTVAVIELLERVTNGSFALLDTRSKFLTRSGIFRHIPAFSIFYKFYSF